MKYKTRVWHPFDKGNYRCEWHRAYLWGIIREFCRDLRRCHERIWKGYCDFDLFSIDIWFTGIMPVMLREFKENQHGYPNASELTADRLFEDDEEKEREAVKAWHAILDRMAFLLEEADEETCRKTNPYEEEYEKACLEFDKKYGLMGEKLKTELDKKNERNGLGIRAYTMNDVPEYRPVVKHYMEEWAKIGQYRQDCKDEALALFSKWFYSLWD